MMKKVAIGLLLVSLIVILFIVLNKKPTEDSVKPAMNSLKAQLIDVREKDEYLSGHADGAINLPLSDIEKGLISSELDKTQEVWLYCRSGARAETAKLILEGKGYKKVKNIGGLADWQTAGGKVCKSDIIDC